MAQMAGRRSGTEARGWERCQGGSDMPTLWPWPHTGPARGCLESPACCGHQGGGPWEWQAGQTGRGWEKPNPTVVALKRKCVGGLGGSKQLEPGLWAGAGQAPKKVCAGRLSVWPGLGGGLPAAGRPGDVARCSLSPPGGMCPPPHPLPLDSST